MHDIIEIQYPIGQGGLHLGIIGNKAYIYDCGSHCHRKDTGFYKKYFGHICELLERRGVSTLHIYLSHMHDDHYNLLIELAAQIKSHCKAKRNFYLPEISNREKIYLLAEYSGGEEKYESYRNFLNSPQNYLESEVIYLSPEHRERGEKKLEYDWILDPFIKKATDIKISDIDIQEIFKVDINTLSISDIDLPSLEKLRKKIKLEIGKNDMHLSMICLYSGPKKGSGIAKYASHAEISYDCHHGCDCPHRSYHNIRYGWLHTGDIDLKDIISTEFYRHYKGYMNEYVGIMQIPHHCSKHNHGNDFCDIFKDSKGIINISERIFYFTCSISADKVSKAEPNTSNIQKNNPKLLPISEYSPALALFTDM